ncbi:hypothetical protein J4462_01175 [Candidatus Pacearchaeota archaeon]|nr:hypothetical protein [Candidatus Pacearchaeota archaeon]
MYPRSHILFGAIFTLIIWYISPEISPLYLALIFLSSFLIDFDHYLSSVIKTKEYSLKKSFIYHNKKLEEEKREIARGIRKKSDFHLFHTIEFHVLVGLLGLFWSGFFYIFIGMIFHSLLDVIGLLSRGAFHRREYFFFEWLGKNEK